LSVEFAVASSFAASSMPIANGFSQKTCFPASTAALAISQCVLFGAQTRTASQWSNSSSRDAQTRPPMRLAVSSIRSGIMSKSASTSARALRA
jgi:hypothetical protein